MKSTTASSTAFALGGNAADRSAIFTSHNLVGSTSFETVHSNHGTLENISNRGQNDKPTRAAWASSTVWAITTLGALGTLTTIRTFTTTTATAFVTFVTFVSFVGFVTFVGFVGFVTFVGSGGFAFTIVSFFGFHNFFSWSLFGSLRSTQPGEADSEPCSLISFGVFSCGSFSAPLGLFLRNTCTERDRPDKKRHSHQQHETLQF